MAVNDEMAKNILSATTAGMVYSSSARASRVDTDGSFLMIALASITNAWIGFSEAGVEAPVATETAKALVLAVALVFVVTVGVGSWCSTAWRAAELVSCSIERFLVKDWS